jgi:glutaredoxin
MKAIIWSKDYCPYCIAAKELLRQLNIEYEDRRVFDQNTRNQFFESNPGATTVPQIHIDGKRIGGYEDLVNYVESDDFNAV